VHESAAIIINSFCAASFIHFSTPLLFALDVCACENARERTRRRQRLLIMALAAAADADEDDNDAATMMNVSK
jgi:hypothetical protein